MFDYDFVNVNFSMNGRAGVFFEIQKEYSIHPYLGFRQACLQIDSLEGVRFSALKDINEVAGEFKREFDEFWELLFSGNHEEKKEEIERREEFFLSKLSQEDFRKVISLYKQFHDLEAEYKAAYEAKNKILKEHPEFKQLSFQEIQDKYASVALDCKLAKHIFLSMYSRDTGLPLSVAEAFFQIQEKTDREKQIIYGQIDAWSQQMPLPLPAERLIKEN